MTKPKPLSPMDIRLSPKAQQAVLKLVNSYNGWQEARQALLAKGTLAGRDAIKNALFYGPAVLEDQKRLGLSLCDPDLVEQTLEVARAASHG